MLKSNRQIISPPNFKMKQSPKHKIFEHFHHLGNTVDGRNPAPPGMYTLVRYSPHQLAQDSFHPDAFSGFSDGREGTWEMVIDGGITAKTPRFAGGEVG